MLESQVTNQLKGRAMHSPQQQGHQYLMKPHSQGGKMIVYPSSVEIPYRRNDMMMTPDQGLLIQLKYEFLTNFSIYPEISKIVLYY